MEKMNTVIILLSLFAVLDWNNLCKNAFLHRDLDEKIYMEVSPGFESKMEMMCRLKKELYRLKQSIRAWFGRFTKDMISLGIDKVKETTPCSYDTQKQEK